MSESRAEATKSSWPSNRLLLWNTHPLRHQASRTLSSLLVSATRSLVRTPSRPPADEAPIGRHARTRSQNSGASAGRRRTRSGQRPRRHGGIHGAGQMVLDIVGGIQQARAGATRSPVSRCAPSQSSTGADQPRSLFRVASIASLLLSNTFPDTFITANSKMGTLAISSAVSV